MKLSRILTTATIVMAIVGCDSTPHGLQDRSSVNAWLVNSFNDAAIENAIVAQHTLFPYHFLANSAALNDLGKADLGVLAGHYRLHPGQLNVRQGDTPETVYKARVKVVLDELAAAGVDTEGTLIEDGLPGGDGMPSERVLWISTTAGESGTSAPPQGVKAGAQRGMQNVTKGVAR